MESRFNKLTDAFAQNVVLSVLDTTLAVHLGT